MPCGHLIPEGTFPLERYTGCPFCGTPFQTADFVYTGQGSKLRELRLFTDSDILNLYRSLLASPVPLDANQADSLKLLLLHLPLPEDVEIPMKETAMLVVTTLVDAGKGEEAGRLMKSPSDILRYLWYRKTGQLLLIEPRTLIKRAGRLYSHIFGPLDRSVSASARMKENLRLKYGRRECRMVAGWLNALPMSAAAAVENMNPKRGMWVRLIRALRLGEYSRRPGYEALARLLDIFYKDEYTTWQGELNKAVDNKDAKAVLAKLSQRPGLFARSLFATMLRFGADEVLEAFDKVSDRMPSRLLLSLGNAAEQYFEGGERLARPISGGARMIAPNPLLKLYGKESRDAMINKVSRLLLSSLHRRYAAVATESKTMYIDPQLLNIPLAVSDRATTVQDVSCALQGTRFLVEGDAVRLFLQWGKGLHAQHLDMDISARIIYPWGKKEDCAYYHLVATGAKHGGDIRSIPEMVGTAEYIELSLPELRQAGAKYVVFSCNAYSCGSLSPNLVVGWMDSAYPMKVSDETGVAYDPSCVQHMVRISESDLSRGLVFGVLDVPSGEIIWLEMPSVAQTLYGFDFKAVELLLRRLQNKVSVGELLMAKADAQHLELVDSPEAADEAYTMEWALNPADVSALL